MQQKLMQLLEQMALKYRLTKRRFDADKAPFTFT